MSHSNTALNQLLKHVTRHEFETLAGQHHSGQKFRSASRWDQFIGMLTSQLSGRQSLRDIQSNLEAQDHKLYHLGTKPITKSTLARINDRQPAEFYEALFNKLLHQLKHQPGKHNFRFKNPLYSMDASAIDLSLNLFPWAAHRDDTANVKLSVRLNNATEVPELVALSDGNESDMIEGRKFRFPKGSIVAFDKGYVDYEWFGRLTNQGVSFVTSLREKSVYRIVKRLDVVSETGVTSDQVIELNSAYAIKRGAPTLRRVDYRDPETGRFYQFLTNNFTLAASTIAAIYKDRWRVEIFFKTIKQNLKIKHFVGRSKNTILTQIWIAMIAYLLVSFTRFCAKAGWTVQRIMRMLQVSLFERRSLKQLVNPDPRKKQKDHPQMKMVL